ncbi:jagunal protein [Penaeus vannamei]|uniref:Jagunal protein n=1 Tax=Penaeus vannamei TaxID=6689 RepID=A0A3R7MP26_PENVA|nr:jagunal protein [Penaeus vannamei]
MGSGKAGHGLPPAPAARMGPLCHADVRGWGGHRMEVIVLNKGRLRKCVFSHLLLALLMVVKMVPDFLDRLDIFVLEIEELEVPQIYFGLINLFSTVPILLAAMIYFSEFLKYCTEEEPAGLQLWQGYPVAVLWYSFIMIAMQVHIFTLIFAWKLILAWKNRGAAKKGQ